MSSFIDDPAVATLAGYALLAATGIDFNTNTLLTGGVYGSYPVDTISGSVNGVAVTTGNNLEGDDDARTQLQSLYDTITGYPATYTTIGTGPNYSFEPGVYKIPIQIQFGMTGNNTITFANTASVPNPSWVFISETSSISFSNVTNIDYTAVTDLKSIYWIASDSIYIDSSVTAAIKGIFISNNSITFDSSVPNPGAAYCGINNVGTITFSAAGATVAGFGFPAICFLENTPINTDQGIMPISKIIAGVNTINNKRIVAITKTKDENTFLVCFKKDSLGENVPSEDTITSKYHGVEYNGEMIEAHQFLEKFENVVKLAYNNEMMYNILMDDHEKIIVNNLICETLNPDHPYAKKYKIEDVNEVIIPSMEIVCA